MERSLCTEESTLKSSRMLATEFWLRVIGNGAPDIVTIEGLKFGVSSHTELSAHEPIAAPEWFTMVIIALPNVSVRLWYVSGATLPRFRNAVSVCRCPNSTSTGVVITETAGFFESDGCRLAPVMEASKKSTATPVGGVSPMVRVIGTPPTEDALWFMEEL